MIRNTSSSNSKRAMAKWPARRRPPRSPIHACLKASYNRRRLPNPVNRDRDRDNSHTHLNHRWAPWVHLHPSRRAPRPRLHNRATGCTSLMGTNMEAPSPVRVRARERLVRVQGPRKVKVSRKARLRPPSQMVPPHPCPFHTAVFPPPCREVCPSVRGRASLWARLTVISTRCPVGPQPLPDTVDRRRRVNSPSHNSHNSSSSSKIRRGPPRHSRDILPSRPLLLPRERRCPARHTSVRNARPLRHPHPRRQRLSRHPALQRRRWRARRARAEARWASRGWVSRAMLGPRLVPRNRRNNSRSRAKAPSWAALEAG